MILVCRFDRISKIYFNFVYFSLASSIYFAFIVSIENDWHFESVKITREAAAMDTAKKNGIWKNRFNLDTLIGMTIETNKLLQLTTFFCVLSLCSESARIYLFSCSNNCSWKEGEKIFVFEFVFIQSDKAGTIKLTNKFCIVLLNMIKYYLHVNTFAFDEQDDHTTITDACAEQKFI